MWKVVKNGVSMTVRDKHQLDAFLNNGWKLADTDATFKVDGTVIGTVEGDVITVTDKEVIKETLDDIKNNSKPYTKTEINRMPVEELRKMAVNTGVEGADTMTGAELKEYLIAVFGL